MCVSESLKSFVSTVCRGMVIFEETADEGQRRMRKILLESGGTGGGGGTKRAGGVLLYSNRKFSNTVACGYVKSKCT